MSDGLASALGWLAVAFAVFAMVVYFVVLVQRPGWPRLLNGSGLFFSGLALSQAPFLLREDGGLSLNAAFVVIFLILAVLGQAIAALRNRKSWDGQDRRLPEPWDQTVERRGGGAP